MATSQCVVLGQIFMVATLTAGQNDQSTFQTPMPNYDTEQSRPRKLYVTPSIFDPNTYPYNQGTGGSTKALTCYACCGCGGQNSALCSTYGSGYYGIYGNAINSNDYGIMKMCDPNLGNNVCAEMQFFDTTNKQHVTMRQCLSAYSCEGMRSVVGKNVALYTFAPGVYADVHTVKCCQFDLCNVIQSNSSASFHHIPIVVYLLLLVAVTKNLL